MSISETSASELASFLLEKTPSRTSKNTKKKSSKKKPTSSSRKSVKSIIKEINEVSIADDCLIEDEFFNSIYETSTEQQQETQSAFPTKPSKEKKAEKKALKDLSNETLSEMEAFDLLDEIKVNKKEKKSKKEKKVKLQQLALPQITDSKMIRIDEDLALLSQKTLAMYSQQMDIKTKLIEEMGSTENNLQSAFAVLHDYIESFVEYYDSICKAINIDDENGLLAECVSKRMEILVLSKKANKLNKEKKFLVNNSKEVSQAKKQKKSKSKSKASSTKTKKKAKKQVEAKQKKKKT
ncbi:uncharacterized protein HGUI_03571 [Hanseniaspora guilliermondii]|uniref:Uncharacterized protein n=1 Tax=Hanseniaspora guilliermondii TaxID=56406 RepID=A0A1L0B4R2_9ASCO|nr:uncharacterized protein HGUI_03571 [Hanseniaspora guilliermondii]